LFEHKVKNDKFVKKIKEVTTKLLFNYSKRNSIYPYL